MARSKQQKRDEDPSKYAGQSSQEIDDDMGFLDEGMEGNMTGTEGGEAGSHTNDRQRNKSRNRTDSDQQNQDDADNGDENLF